MSTFLPGSRGGDHYRESNFDPLGLRDPPVRSPLGQNPHVGSASAQILLRSGAAGATGQRSRSGCRRNRYWGQFIGEN